MIKKITSLLFLLISSLVVFGIIILNISKPGEKAKGQNLLLQDKGKVISQLQNLHVPFLANEGQIDGRVKFYARTFGGAVFVTKDGEIVYSIPTKVSALRVQSDENEVFKGIALKETFMGGKIEKVIGEGKSVTKVSQFKGNEPSKWKSNISSYELVNLGEVYDGIEMKLKAYGNNVEKLFYVKPNTSSANIRVKIEGTKSLKVNNKGELEVDTSLGSITFTRPVSYQEEKGKRKYVEIAYLVQGNEYSFKVGEYDKTKELVIDPLLASTFLGGAADDKIRSLVIDTNGIVYVAGATSSSNFPTTFGAHDTSYNSSRDVFVAKFDSNLQNLLASTFLGGSGNEDLGYGIFLDIDDNGNIYVAGTTGSSDFPTTFGAYDTTWTGPVNAFVAKFDNQLQNLLSSTLIGSSSYSYAEVNAMAIDSNGNVFVTGSGTVEFPNMTGQGAYIAKFDNNLSTVFASTFLNEAPLSLVIDKNGYVFYAGVTGNPDFPTTAGAYDTTYNGEGDVFISKYDNNLQILLASTFLGGSNSEYAGDYTWGMSIPLFVDKTGFVYVGGITKSSDFPTSSAAYDKTYNGGSDGFISKFDNNLQQLLASTFLGGNEIDRVTSISVSDNGGIYVTGRTSSENFPVTQGSFDTTYQGGQELYVSKFNSNLQNLLASTWIGSNCTNINPTISLDSSENVYVAGHTVSSDFPTIPNSYDTTYNLDGDAFVAKLDSSFSAGSGGNTGGDSKGKDSGESGKCFIATAAYGSYLDPHVQVLREFRDKWLLTDLKLEILNKKFEIRNTLGRTLVTMYYKFSPPIAAFISQHETLKTVTRWALTPVVYSVQYPIGIGLIFLSGIIVALKRKKKQSDTG